MNDAYLNPWYIITLAGEWLVWIFICAFLIIVYFRIKNVRAKSAILLLVTSVLITSLIVFLMKFFIPISRPCTPCIYTNTNCNPYCSPENSFPSGHTAIIFAAFTSIYISIRKKKFLIFFVIPFIVAASRYVLGLHYWFDIVFGSFIGIAIPAILWKHGIGR
jgi:undecaprenyl-diphosphatase